MKQPAAKPADAERALGPRALIALARLVRVAEATDPGLALAAGTILDRALGLPRDRPPALVVELLGALDATLRAEVEEAAGRTAPVAPPPAPVPQPAPAPAPEPAPNSPADLGGYAPIRPADELEAALDEAGLSPADWDRWAAGRGKPSLLSISDEAAARAAAWVRGPGAARIRADLERLLKLDVRPTEGGAS